MTGTSSVVLALAAVCLSAQLAAAFYSGTEVVELNPKTFDQEVTQSPDVWIVEFYAPWCGHCKSLAPEWIKLASQLKGVIKVGAVNADTHRDLGGRYGVKGFPTIKIFAGESKSKNGKVTKNVEDYQGPRTATEIGQYALSRLPNYSIKLTDKNVDAFLEDASKPKVLLFTDKKVTPPMLKSLSLQFRSGLSFAEVKDTEKAVTARWEVDSFPQLIVLTSDGNGGWTTQKYTGELKPAAIRQYLIGFAEPDSKESTAGRGKESKKPQSVFRTVESKALESELQKLSRHTLVVYAAPDTPVPEKLESAGSQLTGIAGTLRIDTPPLLQNQLQLRQLPALALYEPDSSKPKWYSGDLTDAKAVFDFAVAGIPSNVAIIGSEVVDTFMQSGVTPKVVLFTVKTETAPLFRALSRDFAGKVEFAQVVDPSAALKKRMNFKSLPHVVYITGREQASVDPSTGEAALQVIPFVGPTNYMTLASFIVQNLAGGGGGAGANAGGARASESTKPAGSGQIVEIKTEAEYEEQCTGKAGLCVIVFMDPFDSNHDKNLAMLQSLAAKTIAKPFHYVWVSNAFQDFAAAFDLPFGFPNVIAVSPKKLRYAPLIGAFTPASIEEFLEDVLYGRVRTIPLSKLPQLGTPNPDMLTPPEPETVLDEDEPVVDEHAGHDHDEL